MTGGGNSENIRLSMCVIGVYSLYETKNIAHWKQTNNSFAVPVNHHNPGKIT